MANSEIPGIPSNPSSSNTFGISSDPYAASGDLAATDPLAGITATAPSSSRNRAAIGLAKGQKGVTRTPDWAALAAAGGWEASVTSPMGPQFVPAQYFAGDEYNILASLPPDQLSQLQQQLLSAHLYTGSSAVYKGQIDKETADAFARLLAISNLSGTDWHQALATRLSPGAQGELLNPSSKSRLPLVVKLTNPDDIKAVAQDAAKRLYGTYMSDQDLASFTQKYQDAERAYQTASYAATGYNPETGVKDFNFTPDQSSDTSGAATSLTAPATGSGLETQVMDQIRNNNPTQFDSNAFTGRLGTILDALKGSGPTTAASPQ